MSVLGIAAGTFTLLATRAVTAAVAIYALAGVCASYKLHSREDFRRGWRQGYESAVRDVLERTSGRTVGIEVLAELRGEPIPEPWDHDAPSPHLGDEVYP